MCDLIHQSRCFLSYSRDVTDLFYCASSGPSWHVDKWECRVGTRDDFPVWLPIMYICQYSDKYVISTNIQCEHTDCLSVCLYVSGFSYTQTNLLFFHPDVFVLTECDILILLSHWVFGFCFFCFFTEDRFALHVLQNY